MHDSQRLYNLVVSTSDRLGIKVEGVKQREDWNDGKNTFITSVIAPMQALKDFGFTDSEITSFINGSNMTLEYVLFWYIIKKAAKESKNPKEFQAEIITKWYSDDLLDSLVEIADIILDDFFTHKGGTCFTS